MQFTVIFHTTKENRVCKMQEWINGYVTKSVVKVIIKSHWSPRLAGFLSVVHAFIKMMILFTSYFLLVPLCPAGYTGKYCNKPCQFPNYGYGCQQQCLCSRRLCSISTGCAKIKSSECYFLYQRLLKTYRYILPELIRFVFFR